MAARSDNYPIWPFNLSKEGVGRLQNEGGEPVGERAWAVADLPVGGMGKGGLGEAVGV